MQRFKHIIDAVHTLLPTELLILAILVTLNRVKHSAYNHPLASAAIVGHAACGVAPYATSVLVVLAVGAAIDSCPVVIADIICSNLCACFVNLNELGYGIGLCHGSCAVVLNEARLGATELTNHIERSGDKRC